MSQTILELKDITKVYPGVTALDRVSLSFQSGEVHAIVGENGAGKSTFIKVITGAIRPTSGELYFEGKRVEHNSPQKYSRSESTRLNSSHIATSRMPSSA